MITNGQAGTSRFARPALPARRRVLGWAVLVTVMAAWWLTLAPTAIGGPATYVVVVGSSMEPRWTTGDIVVTHTDDSYAVGEVVAVETGAGRAIHRIVGGDPVSGFSTRGDNRATADDWTIRPDDVLGREWFTAPVTIGQVVGWGPLAAALLVFGLIAWPSKQDASTDEREDATGTDTGTGTDEADGEREPYDLDVAGSTR